MNRAGTLRALFISLAIVAIACIIGYFATANDVPKKAAAELARQEKLARAEGIPLTDVQYNAPYVPPSQNAGPLYKTAGQLFEKALADAKLLTPGSPVVHAAPYANVPITPKDLSDPKKLAIFNKYDQTARPAMALVAKAAQLPSCDFGFAISKETVTLFPWLVDLKMFARIAACKAQILSGKGQAVEGLKLLRRYAPMFGHLAQAPGSMHAYASLSVNSTLLLEVGEILGVHGQEPGVAEAAEGVLALLEVKPALAGIVEAENIGDLTMISEQNIGSTPTQDSDIIMSPETPDEGAEDREFRENLKRVEAANGTPGMMDYWRAVQIEETRKYVEAIKKAKNDWLSLEAACTTIHRNLTETTDGEHAMLRVSDEYWADQVDAYAKALSRCRVLRQAAAIFQAWNKTGKLPDKLPLTGEAAHDPLAKGEFHYTKTATGFTVYGVGPHGVNHGGRQSGNGVKAAEADIVFTFPQTIPR